MLFTQINVSSDQRHFPLRGQLLHICHGTSRGRTSHLEGWENRPYQLTDHAGVLGEETMGLLRFQHTTQESGNDNGPSAIFQSGQPTSSTTPYSSGTKRVNFQAVCSAVVARARPSSTKRTTPSTTQLCLNALASCTVMILSRMRTTRETTCHKEWDHRCYWTG